MNPETPDTPSSDEQIRKVYVRDLRPNERVTTVFRVGKKERVTARSGKVFVAATLEDKTGTVDARVFERVDELEPRFDAGDYVLAAGTIIAFHGKPQVVLEAIERLDPGPLDPAEFTPPPAPPAPEPGAEQQPAAAAAEPPARKEAPQEGGGRGGARAVGQIREIVTERVGDPHVKALLLAFLDDPQISHGLPLAPAAKGVHHAYRGGLAEHLLSVLRLTLRVADHYPMADRDLLIAGAVLHDVMKVAEISPDKGFEYTDEGRLVGHLVMTAQKIREKALGIEGFPPLLEQHLTHIVIAHHGKLEYGSPKLPVTLEAYIVHALDSLDSRIASWVEAMQRDPNEKWTETLRLYERQLWKGPVPTQRGKAPVEPRRRGEKKQRPQRPAPQAGAQPQQPAGAEAAPSAPPPQRERREPREPRGERRERPERREPREPRGPAGGAPRELTFKPFSALVPTAATEPAPSAPAEGDEKSEG